MKKEQEFIEHYVNFHNYMDKAHTLLGLYPCAKKKDIHKLCVESVPYGVERLIKCLNISDPRVLRVLREWRNPCANRPLMVEVVDEHIQSQLVADITNLFWRYSDTVYHYDAEFRAMESAVLLEQTIVTSCTAYECFLKEMIPWILISDKECARRFLGAISKPVKEMGKYGFDPLSHVDAIYCDMYENRLMPIFPDIVDFYRDTLKIPLFKNADDQKEVDRIFQIRHCIVHNAAKPDEKWNKKNDDKPFKIDRDSVSGYFGTIHDALHYISQGIYIALKLDKDLAPWGYQGENLVCKILEIEANAHSTTEEPSHKPE